MPYHEPMELLSGGSPDILSIEAMPMHTIDLQDLPYGTRMLTSREGISAVACRC